MNFGMVSRFSEYVTQQQFSESVTPGFVIRL